MEWSATLRVALASVTETEAGVTFLPGALERIRAALTEDVANARGPVAVDGLLRLAVVLREGRNAPHLADAVAAIIRSVPAARAAVQRCPGTAESRDKVVRFAGGTVLKCAPGTDEPVPVGALRAAILIDPHGSERKRAQSSDRKEVKHGCR